VGSLILVLCSLIIDFGCTCNPKVGTYLGEFGMDCASLALARPTLWGSGDPLIVGLGCQPCSIPLDLCSCDVYICVANL